MQRVLNDDKRTFLAANLTELQPEDEIGYRGGNRFSCNIGIAQEVTNAADAIETIRNPSTDLFNEEGSKYTESAISTEDGTEYFRNFPSGLNNPEWIVQGSQAVDPIQVNKETVATPSNLAEIAENTQHPDYQTIFDPFPTGEGNQGGGRQDSGSGSNSVKHPLITCKIANLCP
jgi:hypothetical protein